VIKTGGYQIQLKINQSDLANIPHVVKAAGEATKATEDDKHSSYSSSSEGEEDDGFLEQLKAFIGQTPDE
jgi:hypothetical protein